MRPRALRRPLLLLLIAYMAFLGEARRRGAFEPKLLASDRGWAGWPSVELEATMLSALREDRRGWKAFARARSAQRRPFRYEVLVYWPLRAPPAALPGHTVRLTGRLRRPRPARNPGDFDERAFLADRGAAWVFRAESAEILDQPVPARRLPAFWAERLHRSMRAAFRRRLDAEQARLMEGFTLGYKGALAPAVNRAVQDAGLIHLIVPSGAKVAFLLAGLAALGAWARVGPGSRLLATAIVGGLFCLAAGWEPPYTRAYFAALALQAGRWLGRESDGFQALVVSAWAVLLDDPRALFSAGFQMTYAAMAALAWLLPAFERLRPRPRRRWARAAASAAAVGAIVQAALWPIFAQTFGRGSLAGFFANAVAVPLSPLVLAAGWTLWAASLPPLPALEWAAAGISKTMLAAFVAFSEAAAGAPAAAVPLSPWRWPSIVAYYLALAAAGSNTRRNAALTVFLSLIVYSIGAYVYAPAPLRVVYLKAPPLRGKPRQAALVTFNGKTTWLLGEAPPGIIKKAMAYYGIDRVETDIPTTRNWRLCRRDVCFEAGTVHRGEGEFSIIAARLREGAVEVSTDGVQVHIAIPR